MYYLCESRVKLIDLKAFTLPPVGTFPCRERYSDSVIAQNNIQHAFIVVFSPFSEPVPNREEMATASGVQQ
jgi:hypothetical protein